MNHDSGFDELLAALLLIVVLVVAGVWAGVHLAVLVDAGATAPVSIGDAARATIRLPEGNAPDAWDATTLTWFPPTVVYWSSTAITTATTTLTPLAVWTRRSGPKVGAEKRTPLGVPAEARLARLRDLRPILVPGPIPGRFILGTVRGRLVATESRTAPTQWWRRNGGARRADRSAVAVIGPQRSGKTVNVISGILEWDGPAILSSVRDDLFANTWQNRATKGPVYVFDPFNTLGPLPDEVTAISWSPLQISGTVAGAMEAAAVLLEAAPIEGTTNATYWSKKGEALLWPLLFAAASGNKTMADVVRWLAVQDGMHPTPPPKDASGGSAHFRGEVRQKLEELIVTGEDGIKSDAEQALRHFEGFELLDSRTRSDIYSTSQTLVQPWEDPRIAHASSSAAGPSIDLGMLLDGGTLYVVQPLKNADRFSVVFGGLLGALVKDEAYAWSHTHRRPLPDLLVVIDEAGNTPLQWLPAVASTCSGVGILLVTIWQSKAQIDALYQRQADPLLTNHGSKIFFAGASDQATLNYVSWLCGEAEVAVTSTNRDASGRSHRRSRGETATSRRLVPSTALRQAKPGEGLLIHGTLPPTHIEGRRYWTHRRLWL